MKMTFSKWLLLGVLAFLAGCQSYTVSQLNAFVDEDGNILRVTYGRLEKDHVSTFRVPNKDVEQPFRSKLMVIVDMPDGDSFKAYQTMNMLGQGTLYQTSNKEYLFHAMGISCGVYKRNADKETYSEAFIGVLTGGMGL